MKRTLGLLSLLAAVLLGATGCGEMPSLESPDTTLQAADYASAERAILRTLRDRYPGRTVTLDNLRRGNSRYEYEFTAMVDRRQVTGTYDDYSGRVTVRDSYDPDPNLDSVRREIRRAIEDRYPRAYVDVLDVREGRYRDDFSFSARIDSRRVTGTYNTTIRRLELRDDFDPNPPHNGDLGQIRQNIMDALRRRFPFQTISRFYMEAPNGSNYRFNVYIDDEQRFGYYDGDTRQVRIY